MTESTDRTALYRFFNADERLLYIGISGDPDYRWGQHKADKPWIGEVAMRVIEWLPTRAEAEAAELAAIRTERPLYNHKGTPKMFPKAFDPAPLSQIYCGSAEVGAAFGVNRQRVQQLVNRPDFPRPTVELAMGKVWVTEEVIEWGKAHGRLPSASDES